MQPLEVLLRKKREARVLEVPHDRANLLPLSHGHVHFAACLMLRRFGPSAYSASSTSFLVHRFHDPIPRCHDPTLKSTSTRTLPVRTGTDFASLSLPPPSNITTAAATTASSSSLLYVTAHPSVASAMCPRLVRDVTTQVGGA